MTWFLFVDESGHDRRQSPYEVLAGLAVEDRNLWNLILAIHEAEYAFFGTRLSPRDRELKGGKLLKPKTFRLAAQHDAIPDEERREAAKACLMKGRSAKGGDRSEATRRELTALGQAKLAFAEHVLELCGRHGARTFASIVDRDALRLDDADVLRKDYSFLFERFFYLLDERLDEPMGVVVFDELDRSQCHILVDQMARYFRRTAVGRWRSARIVPEPFFVHSDLTTLIQVADIVAYVVSWGVRFGPLVRPRRDELRPYADAVCRLRHRALRERDGEPFYVWSFAAIDDLRPRGDQEER